MNYVLERGLKLLDRIYKQIDDIIAILREYLERMIVLEGNRSCAIEHKRIRPLHRYRHSVSYLIIFLIECFKMRRSILRCLNQWMDILTRMSCIKRMLPDCDDSDVSYMAMKGHRKRFKANKQLSDANEVLNHDEIRNNSPKQTDNAANDEDDNDELNNSN